jgi:glycosyltransferase involved in cell wall biosynthesis
LIYANTWPLFAQYYIVKAAKEFNIPVVMHVQDIYPESLTNSLPFGGSLLTAILRPIDRYNLCNASRIIAISDKMKAHLVKTRSVESDKIFAVQNWQDEKAFDENDSLKSNIDGVDLSFTFMYLGNIGPLAGVENLMDAFIMANLTNCRLVIAGAGSMRDSLIKKSNSFDTNKIEFWDVPDGKVPEIQSFADVFLLPIKKGGSTNSIPSKLAAYMFSKKPIIASVDEECDTAYSIVQADCGWIVPPENIELLSKAMDNVYSSSEEELNQKGRNGYNYAINNFSRKVNLLKVSAIINELIDN